MVNISFPADNEPNEHRFTSLFACIIEEDDGYTVQVKLTKPAHPESGAWGEEAADSFEAASAMITTLAAEFSIPQAGISIQLRLKRLSDGTRH
jgi:hypothetical protein